MTLAGDIRDRLVVSGIGRLVRPAVLIDSRLADIAAQELVKTRVGDLSAESGKENQGRKGGADEVPPRRKLKTTPCQTQP